MVLKATLNNSDKRLLWNGNRFSCVLEVLLHEGIVLNVLKRQIARLQIILISNCLNYQMASMVIIRGGSRAAATSRWSALW